MTATIKDYLEHEIQRKLSEAAALANTAEVAGRGMEPEETAKADQLLGEAAELKSRVKGMEDQEKLRDRINEMTGPTIEDVEEANTAAKSIGAAFIQSEAYRALKAKGFTGRFSSGPVEMSYGGSKATVTESASPIVTIDTRPGIQGIPTWPLRVADLFAPGTTTSTTVRYLEEVSEVNAAAGTAEGGAKPESTIVFDAVDATVGKIATFLPVSDEMLEDVDQMESFLNERLGLFVRRTEDSDLLNGAGTPTVKGILQFSGIQSGSALSLDVDSSIDAIFRAMTAVQVTGLYEPDGIVVNPTDWASIRLMKDNNKQYYSGGPFTGAYGNPGAGAPNDLWGLPVISTTAIAQGTCLVGAFRTAAQIFRKRGLTVEMSNSHNDFFQKDLTAIRAEIREALAVYRQSAFFKITGIDQLTGS